MIFKEKYSIKNNFLIKLGLSSLCDTLEKILLENRFINNFSGHDISHLRRVCNYALIISTKQKIIINLQLIIVASYVHDLHWSINNKEAILLSVDNILNSIKINFNDKELKKLKDIILYHDERKTENYSIEFDIIQDADKIDRYGINGFVRAIQCGAYKGEAFINDQAGKDTISHIKFLLNEDNLKFNTKIARKISRPLIKEMYRLVKRSLDKW